MEAYAVIETGGKQYRVAPGNKVDIERLDKNEGDEVAFDSVLAVSDGTTLTVGTPIVEGAKVLGTVVKNFRGERSSISRRSAGRATAARSATART